MSWYIEWKEWDSKTQTFITNSDSWNTWDDVVRIFNDCITDTLCCACKVTCFWGENPYPADDPVVLEYRL